MAYPFKSSHVIYSTYVYGIPYMYIQYSLLGTIVHIHTYILILHIDNSHAYIDYHIQNINKYINYS